MRASRKRFTAGLSIMLFLLAGLPVKAEDANEPAGASEPGKVSIGTVTFSTDENVEAGWDSSSGSGWKNVAGEYVAMVNYDGSDAALVSEKDHLTIVAAGLNRLKRISGSGDIDLAGTGILLVDEIELSESSKFSLYPYGTIYSSGSVAVFLKEAGTENSYRMINGALVEGVLDERYVIPAGIKLIVPANAVLRLETVMAVFREDEGGEQDETPEYYTAQDKIKDPDTIDQARTVITAGNLTIPENTSLVIETDGEVRMSSIFSTDHYVSSLTVNGHLTNNGKIRNGIVETGGSASVSGTGAIVGVEARISNPAAISDSVKFDSSQIIVADCGSACSGSFTLNDSTLLTGVNTVIDRLNVYGESVLEYEYDVAVNSISIADDAVLDVCATDYFQRTALAISKVLRGGTLKVLSGHVVLAEALTAENTVIAFDENDCIMENRSSMPLSASFAPLVFTPEEALESIGDDTVPVVFVKLNITKSAGVFGFMTVRHDGAAAEQTPVSRTGYYSFSDLVMDGENYKSYIEEAQPDYPNVEVEIYRIAADGTVSVTVLDKNNGNAGAVEDAFLIRIIAYTNFSDVLGGGTVTDTTTTYTGTGALGSGSGNVRIGTNGESIFSGTGLTSPDPAPSPSPQPTAGPTAQPTARPTTQPTAAPSAQPTAGPEQRAAAAENRDKNNAYAGRASAALTARTTGADQPGTGVRKQIPYRLPEILKENNSAVSSTFFAVFSNPEGQLVFVPADYDPVSSSLSFTGGGADKYAAMAVSLEQVEFTAYNTGLRSARKNGRIRWLELTMHAEDEWLHIPEGSTVRLALDYPAGRTGMHVFYEDESGMLHDTAAEYDASAGILTLDVPSGGRLFTVTGADRVSAADLAELHRFMADRAQ